MQLNGVNGPANITRSSQIQAPQSSAGEKNSLQGAKNDAQPKDTVDISQDKTLRSAEMSRNEKAAADGIRHELVNRVRAEIMAGTYDTDEKMDIALARLLGEMEGH